MSFIKRARTAAVAPLVKSSPSMREFGSRSRQIRIVKTGSDSSTAKSSATVVNVMGAQNENDIRIPVLQWVWQTKEPSGVTSILDQNMKPFTGNDDVSI